jgi:hypothetical protein
MDAIFTKYQNWNNHLPLLGQSFDHLEKECKSLTVVEYGMGEGSTPQLHEYCQKKGHMLYSFDNSEEWASAFKKYESKTHKIRAVYSWDDITQQVIRMKPDLVLIDHAPGERRCEDVGLLMHHARIIVIHDSEPWATGYKMYPLIDTFNYVQHQFSPEYKAGKREGAWATAVSMQEQINFMER